ncbi:EAL domain-containing protein [Breoghania sp. L-A4]|uniref:putative bifunctional diguanylate cyclase/phosphodiesterase n=1 Tax=Breoghania sp. L-A4 TaxID=2304600 RepID=UPI000E35DDD3|nr:EAL domain-containing protein [Breoghania sp. L-A4]AXS39381.1 EAL domain-containing protein [Breoghania sp. L-A4]
MSKLSIRHRLNIIVSVLLALIFVALGIIGYDVRTAIGDIKQEQTRLDRLQTVWPVVLAAARSPGDRQPALTLAEAAIARTTGSPPLKPLEPLLSKILEQPDTLSILKLARDELPQIAFHRLTDTGANWSELEITRLLSIQIPEFIWRLANLHNNAHGLAASRRLGPGDRMQFLVNAGQFKASADTIDANMRKLAAAAPGTSALSAASARYGSANGAFQTTAAKLAWTINATEAPKPFNTRAIDRGYDDFIAVTADVWDSALEHVSTHVDSRLNARFRTMLAVTATALLFTGLALWFAISLSDSIVRAIDKLETSIRTLADSVEGDAHTTTVPEVDGKTELARIAKAVVYYRDRVTDRIADALQDEKRRELELLFERNPVPMFIRDPVTDRILNVNQTAVDHYGYSHTEFRKLSLQDLRPAGFEQEPSESYDGSTVHRHRKANGETVEVIVFERTIGLDGQNVQFAAIVDITERRRAENRLSFLAHYDALTSLANRVLLHKHLGEEIELSAADPAHTFSLLCLDLDRFKNVNDTLGHDAGDQVLKAVADRLCKLVGPKDTVSRLGGDEFTILLKGPIGPDKAEHLAERICQTMAQPFYVGGSRVILGASVGISHHPCDATDNDALMKHADLALNRAKANGRGSYCVFEVAMDEDLRKRQALEGDLRDALTLSRFELYYQPLVNISTNTISGFEALLRWHDPERGMVSPTEFIPIAEDVGLIEAIGTWVLNQACHEVASWSSTVKVAVNVSSYQFRDGQLVDVVKAALDSSGLDPQRLELEITESVLLADSETTLETLHRIRKFGVRIAMDDFGTGYSSLSYLRSFPFDKVKIDRSFVGDLGNTAEADAIVRAIAGLSSELGMMTTAEGIETHEQLLHVQAHGCTEAQGFLTGRPVPASVARELGTAHTDDLRAILERMKKPDHPPLMAFTAD